YPPALVGRGQSPRRLQPPIPWLPRWRARRAGDSRRADERAGAVARGRRLVVPRLGLLPGTRPGRLPAVIRVVARGRLGYPGLLLRQSGLDVRGVGRVPSNDHGLESAKPDLQSLFKKPVGLARPESRAGARADG